MNREGVKTASVTVNWGSPKDTIVALRSLDAMTVRPDLIICVDNGSSAQQLAELRAEMPRNTVVLELGENTGVAAANSAGMDYAVTHGVEWTLLLNNDATVDPGCLDRCLAEATSEERIAVVGPAVIFADQPDRLWFAGGRLSDWFGYSRHQGLNQPSATPPPTSDVGYISSCCALVSSAAWRDVGPVRADYFMYYEDTEWCQRARAAGWKCRFLGEVLGAHAVSASGGERGSLGLTENMAYYLARNPLRCALESKSLLRKISRVIGLLTVWAGFNVWRIIRSRNPAIARAYLLGLADGVRGRMGIRPGAA